MGLLLTFCTVQNLSAQEVRIDPLMEDYQSALQQYRSSSYTAAYHSFLKLEKELSDRHSMLAINTHYYKTRSAMQLFHTDAAYLMQDFLIAYPNSTLFYEASRNLADYYYQKRDYKNAVLYYQSIDITQLRKKFRENYKFQYAYSLFEIGEMKAAASFFHDLISKDNEYNSKAKYYFGYIAYGDHNYATAKKYFLELLEQDLYLEDIPLYVAQIYHEQRAYEELISFGLNYIDSLNERSIEMYKILAEAYYHKKDYEQSIYFFNEKYLSSGAKLDDHGNYLLGQAYYRTSEFSLASSAFNKIVEAEDSLAQNAYYYLADCYLELGDKRSAQNAFESASYFNFNYRITEHANFNFAKLCYELGYPYSDPTMILQDFINDFPDSEYIDETYSYLVNAFLTHKDYSRAIKSMETNGLENIRLQQAYQEVSYYRAVQLFNDGNYHKAIVHFDKALVYTHNKTYEALAHYWKAESNYRLEQYENSIVSYKSFQNSALASTMPEFELASYHIAYANFKLWKFDKALTAFESFAGNAADTDLRLHDAFARMGDSHYMLKEYTQAIADYEKAIELRGVDADYAAYQIALAFQQMENDDKVVECLLDFGAKFSNSTYRDDALYRMGESYIKLLETDKAIEVFNKIEIIFPNSPYLADAKMKIGLVLYNAERYMESINEFKAIVSDSPATSIAREAISNARSAYVDLGDVQAYADWVETLSFVNISTSALDSTAYESAELQYLKGNHSKAFTGFESYIHAYPEGLFKLSAYYYFAQSAVEIDSLDQALAAFEVVNSYHNNAYTHSALKQTALLYQEKGMHDKALEKYEKLDAIAETVEAQLFAKQGLMACYFELAEYENAIEQAELVLNSGRVDESLILELNTFVARAAFLAPDRDLAVQKYLLVESASQGELKAEAMYHLAYLAFYEGAYEQSKQIVFEQSRLLPLYKKWLGKSFIVLAKNYWEEEDVFQATHTLEQLIINIDEPDVLKEARTLKAEILAKENKEQDMSLGLDHLQMTDSLPIRDSLPRTDSLRISEE